jgi:4-hydroxybenzoate polyprenyltransferase
VLPDAGPSRRLSSQMALIFAVATFVISLVLIWFFFN